MQICPGCGEENPDRFRLCGFCGTALAPAAPSEEIRRTVTVVFSDLKGSTSLAERLDTERLRELLNVYFNEMRGVLERHGGTVEKYIGDAIMAVFGLPRVREDDAIRAVRAAFEMKERLAELNDGLEARFGVRLENRTGVTTGEVVAGDVSAGQRLVTGDTVNTAARLEQNAPALEILIGHPTYRLVRDAVTVESVEPLELKGKAEAVQAYLLRGVADREEGYARRLDLPIVGREHELERLRTAFDEAIEQSRCHLVTVFGQAGVGKSRLLAEFLHRAPSTAARLHGRCLSYGEGITYWPIGEMVRHVAGIAENESLDDARAKLEALLPGHPDVVARVGGAIGLLDETFSTDETFWAIRRAMELMAASGPLIVLVDDIHWAELTFLDLLRFLVAECRAPVLILCSSRRELVEEHADWVIEADRIDALFLEPLDPAESGRVIENLLGAAELEPSIVRRIVDAAEGNPLYVEQMLSMLIDDGVIRSEDGRWVAASTPEDLEVPATISALLTARLDHLPPAERTVIDRGAVVGQIFYRGAVVALSPDPVRSEVDTCLTSLATRELIRPDEETIVEEATYRFVHALIRDAAYRGLLKRTRAELHEGFVDWLEATFGDRVREYEEIRGYHLEQAFLIRTHLGADPETLEGTGRRAAGYLGSAGRRALARGDLPAAAGLLRRAAGTLPTGDPEGIELRVESGEALVDLGQLTEANDALGLAIDAAATSGHRAAELGARIVRTRVRYQAEGGDPTGTLQHDVESSIAELEAAGDALGLLRAHRLLLLMHWTAGRHSLAEQAGLRMLELARETGDRTREVRVMDVLATCYAYGPTPVPEAIDRCRSLLQEVGGDHKSAALITVSMAKLEALRGNFDEARRLYRRSRSTLEEFGWNLLAALTSIDSGSVEMLAGDPVAAEAELRRDFETLDAMGERNYIATTAAYLAFALLLQRRDDEADRFARFSEATAAEDDLTPQFLWRQFRALLSSHRGDHDGAIAIARRAVELTDRTEEPEMQGNARLDLAAVLTAAGRTHEAEAAYVEALDRFEHKGATTLLPDVRERLAKLRSPA